MQNLFQDSGILNLFNIFENPYAILSTDFSFPNILNIFNISKSSKFSLLREPYLAANRFSSGTWAPKLASEGRWRANLDPVKTGCGMSSIVVKRGGAMKMPTGVPNELRVWEVMTQGYLWVTDSHTLAERVAARATTRGENE